MGMRVIEFLMLKCLYLVCIPAALGRYSRTDGANVDSSH
jgi:hypothetical protein